MDSLQTTKTRLRAVKNIGQITKAMEVVSANKMRRAQEVAIASRSYAIMALEILGRVAANAPVPTPLMTARPVATTAVLVVSSDRGLAGSFNTAVFRKAEEFLANDVEYRDRPEHRYVFVTVGRKATAYAAKRRWVIAGKFEGFGDYATLDEIAPLADRVVTGFVKGSWDRVIAVSTHFRSTLRQDTLVRQLLPTDMEKIQETVNELVPERGRYASPENNQNGNGRNTAPIDFIFEPTQAEALASLVPHLVAMQIYHLLLEANASEHSARRVAMKSASDNADDLSGKLTIAFNKARQAGITRELIEITSTRSALE
ncbi:MAG: ATP synthase F1 subunit gamma [Candidatus Sungbacteria bacterium RIFCSPLOWO2_01_FULL_59_16]|uniref:ATP synthase gamma chain n=1 Tax=Candidatus Sungbacteria bacterium RIFCSPLOWO2_01_FULL_59_16 TaxID=1802280 RepID=A0A1G2LCN1_9BACT|nr:MAG: ATP synthase F1 subunit gamma [Candidatus Sungbacteria bacterium RIFCSPLOWO2_01_FULL_59_16]